MDYTDVTNPVYGDADKKTIQCEVTFTSFAQPVPFIAMADDPEAHGAEIYADLVAGKYGAIGDYVAPAPTPQAQYTNAINAGLQLTSTATPALNGNYSVQDADIANVNTQAQFISLYQQFTSGDTLQWPDTSAKMHTFSTTASFLAFAKAAVQYNQACRTALAVLQSGGTATLPSNKVTIA